MCKHIMKAKLPRKNVLENMLGLISVVVIYIPIQNVSTLDI